MQLTSSSPVRSPLLTSPCGVFASDGAATITIAATEPAPAFSTVFRDHWNLVHCISRHACGSDDAPDVAQEVFLRYFSNPEQFDRDRGSMRAYLATMARGAAIDRLRRDNSRRAREGRRPAETTAAPVGENLERTDDAARVTVALGVLTTEERASIVAAYFGERTYREVAIQLDIPEGTVKSRIRSGLRKMQRELRDVHEGSSPAGSVPLQA